MTEADPTLARLEDQISWYDRKSNYSQQVYKWIKIIEIVAAALVPLAAGLHLPAPFTGSLGVLIAALEGILQLNQYHHNWITYRSTCETLKHEKYLYLAMASVSVILCPLAAICYTKALKPFGARAESTRHW